MRTQHGQRIETRTAFFLRFYAGRGAERRKITVKLANKSETFRTWADVEHLIRRELDRANDIQQPTVHSLGDFVEDVYLPYVEREFAAVTSYSYARVWRTRWKDKLGSIQMATLETVTVSKLLTEMKSAGLGAATRSHAKHFLSGVYVHALKTGYLKGVINPVPAAGVIGRRERRKQQPRYTLDQVLAMLAVLEPIDLRAAAAVALCYFAALRPAEARGLKWEDVSEDEISVHRSVWTRYVGEVKTEASENTVPVIEPLRGLLAKLRDLHGACGWVLQNAEHKPLCLNTLNTRTITPALKAAGIPWHGYYACRRGISSLVTDTSTALNSTGLLRHSNPSTTLSYYTRAQKESIRKALEQIEELATKGTEVIQ